MKSKLSLLAILVIASMVLSACSGAAVTTEVPAAATEAPVAATEAPVATTEAPAATAERYPKITIALATDPLDLTPVNYNAGSKPDIYQAIYETLFDLDAGVYVPRLAKGYTEVDELHWEVELYDYIYDHQGNHITADDVVFSYDHLIESGFYFKFDLFESVEKVDDYHVLFTWTAPVDRVGGLEHPLCRAIIFSQKAFEAGDFATKPVGTGPYAVTEFVSGSKVVLEANDNYWQTDESLRSYRQQSNVQTIEYLIISEPAQHVIALESGTIDYSDQVPAESLAQFQDGGAHADKYDVYPRLQGKQWVLVPNQSEGHICSDINFRLAIFYAIDNESVAQASGGKVGAAKAFGSPAFTDYVPAWEKEENYITTYDPELAKEYLAETDYADETLVLMASNDPETKNIATIVQAFLTNVGIKTELVLVDGRELAGKQSDPAAWDININWIGGGYQVGSWNRVLNNKEFGIGKSMGFVADDMLQELYLVANTIATHTDEDMTKVHDYVIEHAYLYMIGYGTGAAVYSNAITELVYRENTSVMPAASTYRLD
jgi:ABC-type transport system substrate-binding protein